MPRYDVRFQDERPPRHLALYLAATIGIVISARAMAAGNDPRGESGSDASTAKPTESTVSTSSDFDRLPAREISADLAPIFNQLNGISESLSGCVSSLEEIGVETSEEVKDQSISAIRQIGKLGLPAIQRTLNDIAAQLSEQDRYVADLLLLELHVLKKCRYRASRARGAADEFIVSQLRMNAAAHRWVRQANRDRRKEDREEALASSSFRRPIFDRQKVSEGHLAQAEKFREQADRAIERAVEIDGHRDAVIQKYADQVKESVEDFNRALRKAREIADRAADTLSYIEWTGKPKSKSKKSRPPPARTQINKSALNSKDTKARRQSAIYFIDSKTPMSRIDAYTGRPRRHGDPNSLEALLPPSLLQPGLK
jgi:hypothetical protein